MPETMEDPMLEQPVKKRKRSGKERQQKKAEAIAAAAAAAQAELDGVPAEVPTLETQAVAEATGAKGKRGLEGASNDVDKPNADEAQGAVGDEIMAEPSDVFDLETVKGRVSQGLKSMLPVLKRAKTSETQRLIKKIKFLRKKSEGSEEAAQSAKQELADLEQQLDIIKRLELSSLVQPLLSLKLRKHPQLKPYLPLPNDFFPESTKAPVASSTLQIKVENRLYSSKPTSDAIAAVVNWVVGQEGASLKYAHNKGVNAANKARNAGTNQADVTMADVTMEDVDGSNDVREEQGKGAVTPPVRGEQELEEQEAVKKMREQVEAEEAAAEAAGWKSGSLGGDDEEDEVGSESEVGSEDGDDSDDSGAIDWDAPEWEGIPDADDETAASDEVVKPVGSKSTDLVVTRTTTKTPELPKKKNKEKTNEPVATSTKPVRASTATITSSLFLPSLKAGYTLGDYDSDPDEDERRDNKRKGLNPNGERKNRRGQRERRLIAEKKYGAGAKHVQVAAKIAERENRARQFMQKQSGEGTQVGGSWSKGAVGDQGWGRRRPVVTGEPKPAGTPAAARPAVPVSTKPIVEKALDKPAHPSWEAARLRKQKEAQMASAALSGGGQAAKPKKIVFD